MSPTLSSSQRAFSPARQAFRILQFGFVAAPILAGLDKFPIPRRIGVSSIEPAIFARLMVQA